MEQIQSKFVKSTSQVTTNPVQELLKLIQAYLNSPPEEHTQDQETMENIQTFQTLCLNFLDKGDNVSKMKLVKPLYLVQLQSKSKQAEAAYKQAASQVKKES